MRKTYNRTISKKKSRRLRKSHSMNTNSIDNVLPIRRVIKGSNKLLSRKRVNKKIKGGFELDNLSSVIGDIINKSLGPLIQTHLDSINKEHHNLSSPKSQSKFCMRTQDEYIYNGLTITENLNTALQNAYRYGSYGYKPTSDSQPMLIIPKDGFIDEELKRFFTPLEADYDAFVKPVPTSLIPFILKSPLQIQLTGETFEILKESVDYTCRKNPYL